MPLRITQLHKTRMCVCMCILAILLLTTSFYYNPTTTICKPCIHIYTYIFTSETREFVVVVEETLKAIDTLWPSCLHHLSPPLRR